MTWNELISEALQELGKVAAGEVLSADDAATGLTSLNGMIDEWGAERLTIYKNTRTTWTITASAGTYTVGSGGDVDIVCPSFIDSVKYNDTSTSPETESPLGKLTDAAWRAIPQKDATATYPSYWYYNPAFALGLGSLSFLPIPTSSDLEGVLYYPEAVTEVTAPTDTIYLPKGYRSALMLNLALRLAPKFNAPVSAVLGRDAVAAMARIRRLNIKPADLRLDSGALGSSTGAVFDINTGV